MSEMQDKWLLVLVAAIRKMTWKMKAGDWKKRKNKHRQKNPIWSTVGEIWFYWVPRQEGKTVFYTSLPQGLTPRQCRALMCFQHTFYGCKDFCKPRIIMLLQGPWSVYVYGA